jgi:hypothetical protein
MNRQLSMKSRRTFVRLIRVAELLFLSRPS